MDPIILNTCIYIKRETFHRHGNNKLDATAYLVEVLEMLSTPKHNIVLKYTNSNNNNSSVHLTQLSAMFAINGNVRIVYEDMFVKSPTYIVICSSNLLRVDLFTYYTSILCFDDIIPQ